MLLKTPALVASLAATLLLTSAAHADDADVCKDSYEQAQRLMKQAQGSSLVPAREKIRTCMRSNCKDWMVEDCSKWLAEVEGRIPTAVFSAKDAAGKDVTDARVTTRDGKPIMERLDGRAIELEPGQQTFVFLGPDGARREETVLVREGEKAQKITTTFEGPAPAQPGMTNGEVAAPPPPPDQEQGSSTLRYVGYGVAAAGVIGLGLGAAFGISAMSSKDDAKCEASFCDAGPLSDARSAATVSTIGFVAGGVLLAGGIGLVLFAPSSSTVKVNATASVGPNRTGLVLGGVW